MGEEGNANMGSVEGEKKDVASEKRLLRWWVMKFNY